MNEILRVSDLVKIYPRPASLIDRFMGKQQEGVRALDHVSFSLFENQTLGVVGESGCGKTTLGKVLIRLEEAQNGHAFFGGNQNVNLLHLSSNRFFEYRTKIQMIFQNPMGALNPRLNIFETLKEPLTTHKITKDYHNAAVRILRQVGLTESYLMRYPHEMSGGQRQRVNIARALCVNPRIIIADEAVSALDVSTQINILQLLNELKQQLNLSYIFITHDLGVARYLCDQILVMYLGEVVEFSSKEDFFRSPKHPYSKLLLKSVPKIYQQDHCRQDVTTDLSIPSVGCKFAPRCPNTMPRCLKEKPSVYGEKYRVKCFLFEENSLKKNI